jgi:hypothetical protein
MSRGPGHVERCVELALRKNLIISFSVEELAKLVWPDAEVVAKKHRVSVLRALTNVDKRLPLAWWRTPLPPWSCIVANHSGVRAYAHGYLRALRLGTRWSLAKIEKILDSSETRRELQPGGLFWVEAQILIYERDWRDAGGEYAKPLSVDETDPKVRERRRIEKEVTYLRQYRLARVGNDDVLDMLLRSFEEPSTPNFQWAMKHRPELESVLNALPVASDVRLVVGAQSY